MADIFVAKKKNKPEEKEIPSTLKAVNEKLAEEKEEIEKKGKFSNKDLSRFSNKEVGLFSSFHLYPPNVSFKEQENDEEIILLLRKHFITNVPWILIAFVITVIPTVFFIFRNLFPVPLIPAVFNLIAFLFYFTIIGAYIYINFISWFFNISLITQKRLIDIHFVDILYHDMAVTRLSLIEDISFNQSGFLRSLFNYGDIYAQTAGEKMHFDFLAVPEPDHVLNIVENLMGGERHVH